MAIFFLLFSNASKFAGLLDFLASSDLVGNDNYPKTMVGAYELLMEHSKKLREGSAQLGRRGHHRYRGSGVSFFQRGQPPPDMPEPDRSNPVSGTDGNIVQRQCYRCYKWGHLSNKCPDRPNVQALQLGISLAQTGDVADNMISKSWILLDTCSTDSVVNNLSFVTDIRDCNEQETLKIHTNGGALAFTKLGILKFLPLSVHVNESSMANILAVSDVAAIDGVRLTMDSEQEKSISVHLPDGMVYSFLQNDDGLYFFDTSNPGNHIKSSSNHYSFLSTVAENKQIFTRSQIAGADTARKLQAILGWPSVQDYRKYVAYNHIKNSPVTINDIDRAEHIYGPAMPILQGKMTRTTPVTKTTSTTPVSPLILQHHQNIDLYCDFLFVNKLLFLHTKSKNINFLSIQSCKNRTSNTVINGLLYVKSKYVNRGFTLSHMHADNEFNVKGMQEAMEDTEVNIYAANEHVGVIERSIRTMKERCRCISHAMPFHRHTRLMTKMMLEFVTSRLNAVPSQNGVSELLSPRTIVLGQGPLDLKYKTIEFGSFVLLYTQTLNNMKRRSVPCIALNPTNEFGGHNFMSLESGRKLHGYKWQELPMDEWVIRRVEELATEEGQPYLVDKTPIFEWSPGNVILDYQEEEVPVEKDAVEDNEEREINENANDEENDIPAVTDESNDEDSDDEEEVENATMNEHAVENDVENENDNGIEVQEDAQAEEYPDEAFIQADNDDEATDVPIEAHEDDAHDMIQEEESEPNVRRSSRGNKGQGVERLEMQFGGKTYSKSKAVQFLLQSESNWSDDLTNAPILTNKRSIEAKARSIQFLQKARILITEDAIDECSANDPMKTAINVVFTQMSARQGFKQVGEEAVAAMIKEYKQLNNGPMPGKPVVEAIDTDTIPREELTKALDAVNLIKLKRCGKVKGRSCLNGSKQRRYLKPDESVASPTVSLEALMSTLVIDAHEKRDVAIFDVPGAYLHAKFPKDKLVLMRLKDEFVDIMCKVNPEFLKHVKQEKGRKVLYLRVLRALYGCIESALMWYNLFAKTLVDMGFILNPYDRCVANKTVNGSQLTVAWYVDDCKVSHADPEVVTDFIDSLKPHFGELTTSRGRKHTFLGINFEMTENGYVELEMKEQQKEAIQSFGEDVSGVAVSPARYHLFNVRDNATPLSEEKADIFHSVVAKMLYIMKRVRPDLEPTVAFLSTRVSCSTEDDWIKLKRLMEYVNSTLDDKRIIGANGLSSLQTWIDAAYAVHPNMRSHTGGCMSLGVGTLHAKSSKQKLNTKSSTEAELVGVSEYLPYNIWLVNFLKEQGYPLETNDLLQDNQSAMRMEKNGRNSCTGNSRHIDIRYFLSRIELTKERLVLNTVLRRECLPIFLRNHCKVVSSIFSEMF